MTLYIIEPSTRSAGGIVVCEDGKHNDIAEFFHNEHASVDQSYEDAIAMAEAFVRALALPPQQGEA